MLLDTDKPYVLRVAELIYLKIINIKKENSGMTNIQAIEIFMTTEDRKHIQSSSSPFHLSPGSHGTAALAEDV